MLHRSLVALAISVVVAGCSADTLDHEDLGADSEALGAGRHMVIADVDKGGGVILANRPGGFYMGRLFPGMTFDRDGAWYLSSENGTNYAWGMAFGHSNACVWIGPSRGKSGFTAGKWASAGNPGKGRRRCDDAKKRWLAERDASNLGSHFNCPPPSSSAHGTPKALLSEARLYWNIDWGNDYEGGPARDPGPMLSKGTTVWYRFTTRDGNHVVVFVPGVGWGFLPVGVLDRSRTGTWSFPETPSELHRC